MSLFVIGHATAMKLAAFKRRPKTVVFTLSQWRRQDLVRGGAQVEAPKAPRGWKNF